MRRRVDDAIYNENFRGYRPPAPAFGALTNPPTDGRQQQQLQHYHHQIPQNPIPQECPPLDALVQQMQQLAFGVTQLQQLQASASNVQRVQEAGITKQAFKDLPKALRKPLLIISDNLKKHFQRLQECNERLVKIQKGWTPDIVTSVKALTFQIAKEEYVEIGPDKFKIAHEFEELKKSMATAGKDFYVKASKAKQALYTSLVAENTFLANLEMAIQEYVDESDCYGDTEIQLFKAVCKEWGKAEYRRVKSASCQEARKKQKKRDIHEKKLAEAAAKLDGLQGDAVTLITLLEKAKVKRINAEPDAKGRINIKKTRFNSTTTEGI